MIDPGGDRVDQRTRCGDDRREASRRRLGFNPFQQAIERRATVLFHFDPAGACRGLLVEPGNCLRRSAPKRPNSQPARPSPPRASPPEPKRPRSGQAVNRRSPDWQKPDKRSHPSSTPSRRNEPSRIILAPKAKRCQPELPPNRRMSIRAGNQRSLCGDPMNHHFVPRAVSRARWLAELSAALDDAQTLLSQLAAQRIDQADADGLRAQNRRSARGIAAAAPAGFAPSQIVEPTAGSIPIGTHGGTELPRSRVVSSQRSGQTPCGSSPPPENGFEKRPDRRRFPARGGAEAAVEERLLAIGERRPVGAVDPPARGKQHGMAGGRVPFAGRRQARINVGAALRRRCRISGESRPRHGRTGQSPRRDNRRSTG